MPLLITSFATFGVWEFLIVAIPWIRTTPAWIQPLLVLAISGAISYPDWRVALASMGCVAILHVLVSSLGFSPAPAPVKVARRSNYQVPNLP